MNTISQKYIRDYIEKNYGKLRHDTKKFANACRKTAKIAECTPKEIFHFIIENKDFNGFCNSYGFNTSYGRNIKEEFQAHFNA